MLGPKNDLELLQVLLLRAIEQMLYLFLQGSSIVSQNRHTHHINVSGSSEQ